MSKKDSNKTEPDKTETTKTEPEKKPVEKDKQLKQMESLAAAIGTFITRTSKPFEFKKDHAILIKIEKGIFNCSVVTKKN